jgi:16S rRNA (adenine1518-N6/adenine1519-N6)-dimethyltransferase
MAVLLVQKEVAERIVARPAKGRAGNNKESILSLSVKAYGNPKYMMKVGKRFFTPSPKVDSAIIAINDISNKNFETKKEELRFFELIKLGFAHKRKVLRKNLENTKTPLDKIDEVFKKLNINPMSRAEDLELPIWISINKLMN